MSITSGLGLVSQIEKFGKEIAGNSYDNYYVLRKGDFAYNKSSTKLYPEGEVAMLEKEENGAVPNSIFTCFSFDKNKIYPIFAKYPFINNIHGRWLKKFIAVGARANGALQVNSKDLFSIPFPYPSFNEQQKIASCLSSLDEVITAESQKLELLKEHKKGLLQNLFPQEGETVPKLRFKEFEESGEWEVKRLGEICEINNGKANAQDHIENGRYPLFDRSEVIKASNEFIFDTEAVIIPGEGMRFIPKYYKGKFNLHQRAYALNNFKCFGNFIYYSILNKSTILSHKAVQSTVLSLRLPILQNLNIELPKSLLEQQKIASCLSSLDDLINAQRQKIELLKQHKKGLLQGLFPPINN
jgi:type I restriction enzyme S subunit